MRLIYSIIFILFCNFSISYSGDKESKITIYIPAFEGEQALALQVATILNLQIWQTFRKVPWPNPQNVNFGKGMVLWSANPFKYQDHNKMESIVIKNSAQLGCWGNVLEFGDGVIVQSFLTIPKYFDNRTEHPEIWEENFQCSNRVFDINVDIPRRRYEFSPIVLSKNFIQDFGDFNIMKIYKTKKMKKFIGFLGSTFRALDHDADFSLVKSGNKTGWILLPNISTHRSEVVDFVGGVIRMMRADWFGAIKLFDEVLKNNHTSTSIKIDSYLYKALAKYRTGSSPQVELNNALELNPYLKTTIKYYLINQLSKLKTVINKKTSKNIKAELLEETDMFYNKNKYLFSKNDSFGLKIKAILECLKTNIY